jgi:DNA-binding SARP family transcriptional activator/tetratricopeptide (TPR) repeat protein
MVRLLTLGELRVEATGERLLSSRRKELVLLAYLRRREGRPLSRAEAAALLWPDRDERLGRQSLRQALLELRRLVGDGLVVESEQVQLQHHAIELDISLFEQDLDASRPADAVARWKGEFLPGIEEIAGEELRTWVEAEREGLRRRLRSALSGLVDDASRRGAWQEGIGWAERWVSALPLDLAGHLQFLRLLHLERRTGEALARFGALSVQLRDAGVEPSPELKDLGRILEREALSAPSGSSSAALFTPDLVGRGAALAELDAAWRRVRQGTAGVVVIEGELGIGKTRLCEEFLQRLTVGADRLGLGRVHGREEPALVEWGGLNRLMGGLASARGLAGTPPWALALLATIAPAVRQRFSTLTEATADPRALPEAFREAVAGVAEEGPTVLFVDDLPQLDDASRRALLLLIEHLPPGVLVLATARTGDGEPPVVLPFQRPIRRLKLQPLSLAEVELLVGSILQLATEDRHHLATRLHTEGGGNPFYIVELVSALADEGTLAPTERGAWRLTAKGDRLPLPTSIREVIGRRVARLSPQGRSALEAAAILALPFDRELLAKVVGDSPASVETGLEELLLHRLIREAEAPGRYLFTHELVRRHVYQTVPVTRGEEISRRAVAALERRAGDDPMAGAALAQHRARLRTPAAARRRRMRIGIGAALAAGVLASAGLLSRDAGTTPADSTIAVLPFPVTGAVDLAYLREGIVTLLSTQLDGVGTLRSADPRAVLGIAAQVWADAPGNRAASAAEPEDRVARRVGAGTYVRGSIVEVGGRILIEATAHRAGDSPKPIARAVVEGPTAELFELVDKLAAQLLTALSGGPYEQLTRIAASTTTSLPALKAYLEGERRFRAGSFEAAARAFRHAATEDTTFALAYYWLSVAAWWTDDAATLDQAAAAAVRFSGRLRAQDRRILDGWQAFLRGDAVGAERVYRGIVRDEPEHVEAWLQLGELLFHSAPRRGRAASEARPAFERVLEFEPEHTSAILHLARLAAAEGRRDDLDSLARRALEIGATGEWATEARLHLAFARRDARALDAVVRELRTQPEGRAWNGAHYIALAHGDIAGARRLVTLLTDAARPRRVRAFGHIGLAYLALAEGRLRAAGEELDRAADLDPVAALEYRGIVALLPFVSVAPGELDGLRDSLSRLAAARPRAPPMANLWPTAHDGVHHDIAAYLSARIGFRAGDTTVARRGLDQLAARARGATPDAVVHDLTAALRAELAAAGGRRAEALRELEGVLLIDARVDQVGASPFYSQGLERFAYASLLEASGRLEDAALWYGSFSANSIFDLAFLAPSHLRRGAIAERLGRLGEARRHYEAALALWPTCDAELRPLTDEARTRLVALQTEIAAPTP